MAKLNQEGTANHNASVFTSIIIGSVASAVEVMINHPCGH